MTGDDNHLKQTRKRFLGEKDQIEIQRDLAISLASTDSLSKGLHLCLEACLLVSGMDCGGVYLFDDTTGALNLTAHKGLGDDFVNSVLTYAQDSENVALVKKGAPLYTYHRNLDPSMLSQVETSEGLRAFATIPIFDESKAIGCINIASHFLEKISNSSRTAVETIAAQAGIVIARLKMKEALKVSEEHLSSLMRNAEHYAVYRLASSDTSPSRLQVVFVSPSICDIMGVNHPENFDMWFENVHPDERERVIAANLEAFKTSRFDEVIKICHPEKKESRWIHAVSKGIHNKHGHLAYVNGIILDITERKRAQETLAINEKELNAKTLKLENINTALNVLLKQRDEDNALMQERIVSNVKKIVIPYVDMLKEDIRNENQSHLLNILESNLNDLISTFSLTLSSAKYGLTSMEMLVADLLRQGKKTKEIAILNNISNKTVEVHRNNIRKKLGLKGRKINLQSYLLSLGN